MADIKLKSLLKEETSENKEVVNEMIDPQTAHTLLQITGGLLGLAGAELLTQNGDGGIITNAIDGFKDFARNVTKVRPILNKLDKDPEVQDFLMKNVHDIRDPKFYDEIENDFEKLISKKLDNKDAQYMRDLQINDLPSYKSDKLRKGVEDKNQQWRSDSAAAYRAKQADKLKKIAGGVDLDQKIKNPATDNDITLKTALTYGKDHPVYKAALAKIKQDKGSASGEQKPQEPVKGASMFGKDYKNKR